MAKGDTPDHSRESLCLSCENSTVARGFAESQCMIYCSYMRALMTFPIYECNEYRHRLELSLYKMEQMAMLVEKRKDGGIGFRRLHEKEVTGEGL